MHTRVACEYGGGTGAEGMCWSPTKRKANIDDDELLLDRLQRGVKRMRLGKKSEEVIWEASDETMDENVDMKIRFAQTKVSRQAAFPFHDCSNEPADSFFVVGGTGARQTPTMLIYRTPRTPSITSFGHGASSPSMGSIAFEGTVRSKGPTFLLEGSLNPSALASIGFGDWSWTSGNKVGGAGSVKRSFACRLKSNRKRDESKQTANSSVAFTFTALDQQYRLWDAFSSAVADDGSVFVFGRDGGCKGDGWEAVVGGSERTATPFFEDRFMAVVD
mmetsp:Transcript_28775/g.70532  ORF Transcript_28775/g.70532 Transcript_28775/m.70532 type:complete len:275 (-) Transcript_28775:1904-2728(-)